MRPRLRQALLISLLLAALLWVSEGGGPLRPRPMASSVPPAVQHAAAIAAQAPVAELQQSRVPARESPLDEEARRIHKDRLACVADAGTASDLFAGKSWYVPPPPPKPAPPPPPTAPPLPFGFVGSYQEPDGRLVFFLSKGESLYTVSVGDVIDGIYRVESASGGRLELTYLPLNIRQAMNIGGIS